MPPSDTPGVTLERAKKAKQVVLSRWGSSPRIAGVGITRKQGSYAVKLNLTSALEGEEAPPDEIDGVPIVVEIVGTLKKRS